EGARRVGGSGPGVVPAPLAQAHRPSLARGADGAGVLAGAPAGELPGPGPRPARRGGGPPTRPRAGGPPRGGPAPARARGPGRRVGVGLEKEITENMKRGAGWGAGGPLCPEPTARREVEDGTLLARPLQGCRLVRPLGIIHRRHHKLSATATRFLELLRGLPAGASANGSANGAAHAKSRRGRRANGSLHSATKEAAP